MIFSIFLRLGLMRTLPFAYWAMPLLLSSLFPLLFGSVAFRAVLAELPGRGED